MLGVGKVLAHLDVSCGNSLGQREWDCLLMFRGRLTEGILRSCRFHVLVDVKYNISSSWCSLGLQARRLSTWLTGGKRGGAA